jgi:acetyltransferase
MEHGRDGSGGNNGRLLMDALLGEHRRIPSGLEVRSLLRTYGIAVQPAMLAHSAKEAMFIAEQIGMPVELRVDFHDHDLGSTVLTGRSNLGSLESVRLAYQELVEMAGKAVPGLHIDGVAIEPNRSRPNARKLMLGVFRDPVFGPVISFGAGGEQTEVFQDRAVALPPLNRFLAKKLIESTRVSRTLGEYRQLPAVDELALEDALLSFSNMICDLPWIRELSIDPLIVDESGVTVGSARMVIDHTLGTGKARYAHMAIHPYPAHLERSWPMRDGQTVTVRPIRPEDAPLTLDFFNRLSPESRYFRFMENLRELPPSLVIRFTQVDYDREMALIALALEDGVEQQVGSARYTLSADGESVEFALVVDDRWQRSGLGRRLMGALIDCAREKSYRAIVGDVLADNQKMLRLMTSLGFAIMPHPDSQELKRVVRPLQD